MAPVSMAGFIINAISDLVDRSASSTLGEQ
jgi:hypothetical protein